MSTDFLRVRDASKMLGVAEDTIRNWINRKVNPLPATKIGRDWLIRKTDLDDFIEQQKNTQKDDEL